MKALTNSLSRAHAAAKRRRERRLEALVGRLHLLAHHCFEFLETLRKTGRVQIVKRSEAEL